MLSMFLASLLVTSGFEAGGRIGVLFPASGLENNHSSAAQLGMNIVYGAGPNRFAADYAYSGPHARQANPYRLDIHELAVGYDREFVLGRPFGSSTSSWGLEASAAAGLGLLRREFGTVRETGKAPFGILGGGFYQRQGHSRLSFGLDNIVFVESQPGGSARTVSLTYLIALKGGVAYVF